MNVVLAFIIYIGLLTSEGKTYLPTAEVNKYGIAVDSLGYELGFRDGDKILSVDGKYYEDFSKIPLQIIIDKAKTVEVEREGKNVVIELPEDATAILLSTQDAGFISTRLPFVIDSVADSIAVNGRMEVSPARMAGLRKGDQIIGINDEATPYFHDFKNTIVKYRNQDLKLLALRARDTIALDMHLGEQPLIGATVKSFDMAVKEYSFFQAIPAGFSETFSGLSDYWKQVKLIFSPKTKAYESVGGFISIGKIFPETWIWSLFWRMTAFLSIALAVMNILPIPALDGGHILFLLVEIITRRKPSDKFMEVAETVGLILVLGLVILANGNDIIRLFK
jgi:regulator of sigma E protease